MKNCHYLVFAIDPITNKQNKIGLAGNTLRVFRCSSALAYSKTLRALAKQQWLIKPIDGPLKVEVIFHVPRPKTISIKKRKYPHCKPDLDNLEKLLWDALEGIVFVNDSRIVTKTISKQYSSEGMIEVKIRVLK